MDGPNVARLVQSYALAGLAWNGASPLLGCSSLAAFLLGVLPGYFHEAEGAGGATRRNRAPQVPTSPVPSASNRTPRRVLGLC